MKHFKTVEVPASTRQELDKVTCDFCGDVIAQPRYNINEVKLSYANGTDYPEGGSVEIVKFDCCPKCWNDKVQPTLENIGGKPYTEERDW